MINTFQLTTFEIVVYPTLSKENIELYFLFLFRELGCVRFCESSFCAGVNHDNFSYIKNTCHFRKSYSHSHNSASSWQAALTKFFPCFQLLVESACSHVQFSEGHSWKATYFQYAISIIMIFYWCRFTFLIFLRMLISMLLHAHHVSNYHGSSFWLVCHRKPNTVVLFRFSQALAISCSREKYGSSSIEVMCGGDLHKEITKCF